MEHPLMQSGPSRRTPRSVGSTRMDFERPVQCETGMVKHLTMPATPASYDVVRNALGSVRDRFNPSSDAAGDFTLAVSEAFTNAVFHGDCNGERVIEMWVCGDSDTCCVTLQYPGERFCLQEARLPEMTATRGRGRYLMQTLADEVDYHFVDGLTQVRLIKRWGGETA